MLIASIIKEMRLLSRDLHGVAVLFIMPILFMLIMSAALSNDNALSNRSEIMLLSEKNQLNDDFLEQGHFPVFASCLKGKFLFFQH